MDSQRRQAPVQTAVFSSGCELAGRTKDRRVTWGSVSQPSREAGT